MEKNPQRLTAEAKVKVVDSIRLLMMAMCFSPDQRGARVARLEEVVRTLLSANAALDEIIATDVVKP